MTAGELRELIKQARHAFCLEYQDEDDIQVFFGPGYVRFVYGDQEFINRTNES